MDSNLPIGRLAANAGVNVETIRYYQRRGLLSEPDKPLNGHRRYPAESVKRVRFIKRAQVLGFTLEEITARCRARLRRDARPGGAQASDHRTEAGRSDRDAQDTGQLMRQCDSPDGTGACPIIAALATD